jgi:two-component system cell cycle response regulator DivK
MNYPELKDKVIMIVDDEENDWLYLQNSLKVSKAQFIWARVAQEAIDIVTSGKKIDLILMDMKMPFIDGFEATRRIKKINKSIPIIAQTAYAQPKEKVRCFGAGCDGYVSKPINIDNLLKLSSELIRKKR